MSIDEVKNMIRASLKAKLLEERMRIQSIPQDFDDFRCVFRHALVKTGAHSLAEGVEDVSSPGGIFESIYEIWSNIEAELIGIKNLKERAIVWNEAIEFYMPDVLDALGLDEEVILMMKR